MKFGQEMDIYINLKTQIQYNNLCRHLIRTEKPSSSTQASTTSILHSKASSQRKWRAWDMNTKSSTNKVKAMENQVYGNRKKNSTISLLSKFILLQCFTMAQYISLKWEMEGRIRAFSGIWKAKDQAIRYLMRKTPSNFLFFSTKPDVCNM